jgi:hypothetical protein
MHISSTVIVSVIRGDVLLQTTISDVKINDLIKVGDNMYKKIIEVSYAYFSNMLVYQLSQGYVDVDSVLLLDKKWTMLYNTKYNNKKYNTYYTGKLYNIKVEYSNVIMLDKILFMVSN